MRFAVTATCHTRPTSPDSNWEKSVQVPAFTVEAASRREAVRKAFDIVSSSARQEGVSYSVDVQPI